MVKAPLDSAMCVFRYVDAVRWIALNDDVAELRVSFVKATVSVQLVADAWRVSSFTVARAVVALRRAAGVAS